MADLSASDKRRLERLFRMRRGCVLNFTEQTLQAFVLRHCGLDLNDACYGVCGASKTERLRRLWAMEGNLQVAKLLESMISYSQDLHLLPGDIRLVDQCRQIVFRLSANPEHMRSIESPGRPANKAEMESIIASRMTRFYLV